MDRVIVYVDDAAYAQQVLAPLFAREAAAPTQWVLVACAPRMTHRISKWVSHSARENWRSKWAEKLFGQTAPWLQAHGDTVTTLLAKGPLSELTDKLQAEHHGARVLDVRRPRIGQDLPPVSVQAGQPKDSKTHWHVPGTAMALLGGVLLVAD